VLTQAYNTRPQRK